MQHDRIGSVLPYTGTNVDALWHHLVDVDPVELLEIRRKQKVYLARYMRESVFQWEHREVTELQAYFSELSDLIGKENELSRSQEDR